MSNGMSSRGPATTSRLRNFNGGSGIRTHEVLPPAGFQDRCIQPLCHPSRRAESLLFSPQVNLSAAHTRRAECIQTRCSGVGILEP
jgi:hypothetical protein